MIKIINEPSNRIIHIKHIKTSRLDMVCYLPDTLGWQFSSGVGGRLAVRTHRVTSVRMTLTTDSTVRTPTHSFQYTDGKTDLDPSDNT